MSWLRGRPKPAEIDEELRFHIEEKERRLIAESLTPAEARRAARKAFGSQAAVREYARDAWAVRWIDDLWRDLRFAARGMRRSPGFTTVAVLTLTLGIGANAAIFSFVNALLLRDLPVEKPEELVWFGIETEGSRWDDPRTSYRQLQLLQQDSDGFAELAAVGSEFGGLTVGEFSRPVSIQLVSPDYFRVLGVRAALGRLLDDEESQANATPSVVLSYEVWRNFFNADPSALGQIAIVSGQPFVVVGVAPRGFPGTDTVRRGDVWMPIAQAPLVSAGSRTDHATGGQTIG